MVKVLFNRKLYYTDVTNVQHVVTVECFFLKESSKILLVFIFS